MKKILNFANALIAFILVSSCSSEDNNILENNQEINKEKVTINIGMPDEHSTRVTLDNKILKWDIDDELIVVGCREPGWDWGSSIFSLLSGAGNSIAKFEGFLPSYIPEAGMGYRNYYVCYNAKNIGLSEEGVCYIKNITNCMIQNRNNPTQHIKDNLLLSNDEYVPDLSYVSKLKLLSSILKINVKILPNNIKDANKVSWIINWGDVKKEYRMGTVKFDNSLIGDNFYVYMPFCAKYNRGNTMFGFDEGLTHTLYKDSNFALVFSDDNGNERTLSVKASKNVEYKNGQIYNMVVSDKNEGKNTLVWDK